MAGKDGSDSQKQIKGSHDKSGSQEKANQKLLADSTLPSKDWAQTKGKAADKTESAGPKKTTEQHKSEQKKEQDLQKYLKKHPLETKPWIEQGDINVAKGQRKDANLDYNQAMLLDRKNQAKHESPLTPEFWLKKADNNMELHRYQRAHLDYNEAIIRARTSHQDELAKRARIGSEAAKHAMKPHDQKTKDQPAKKPQKPLTEEEKAEQEKQKERQSAIAKDAFTGTIAMALLAPTINKMAEERLNVNPKVDKYLKSSLLAPFVKADEALLGTNAIPKGNKDLATSVGSLMLGRDATRLANKFLPGAVSALGREALVFGPGLIGPAVQELQKDFSQENLGKTGTKAGTNFAIGYGAAAALESHPVVATTIGLVGALGYGAYQIGNPDFKERNRDIGLIAQKAADPKSNYYDLAHAASIVAHGGAGKELYDFGFNTTTAGAGGLTRAGTAAALRGMGKPTVKPEPVGSGAADTAAQASPKSAGSTHSDSARQTSKADIRTRDSYSAIQVTPPKLSSPKTIIKDSQGMKLGKEEPVPPPAEHATPQVTKAHTPEKDLPHTDSTKAAAKQTVDEQKSLPHGKDSSAAEPHRTVMPDGRIITKYPDGTIVDKIPRTGTRPEQTIVTSPHGNEIKIQRDLSWTERAPSGDTRTHSRGAWSNERTTPKKFRQSEKQDLLDTDEYTVTEHTRSIVSKNKETGTLRFITKHNQKAVDIDKSGKRTESYPKQNTDGTASSQSGHKPTSGSPDKPSA
jgi:hypothetical protein